jgi:hypothetical protein
MSDTTPVNWNKKIQKIRNAFDKILAVTPYINALTLTPGLYDDYCAAIMPDARKTLTSNPKYRGVEIKKLGET